MAYQAIPIDGLLGLNQDENPHALKAEELTLATNAVRRSSNLVGTRPGCIVLPALADYEDPVASAAAIQGAFEYRRDFDEGRRLIVISDAPGAGTNPNSKISYEDDARIPDTVAPTITAGADNLWLFAVHANLLWAAGGATGDQIWTWDGNVANAPVVRALTDKGAGVALQPQYIKEWRGYLLLNGLRGHTTPSDNPAATRYAEFATDPTLDVNWPDSNTLGFLSSNVGTDSFGKSYTTGFGTYQDNNGDFLLALANTHIVSYILDPSGVNDFIRNDVVATGCVHQRAFVDLGPDAGDAIYVSDRGIHSLRQSQQHGSRESAYLSRKIQTIFNSLNPNRIKFTTAAYDTKNGRIVFAFSTGSSTEHDILMALDVRFPESINSRDALWYGPWILPSDVKVNHLLYARDAQDVFTLYAFTTDGRVLQFSENVFHDLVDEPYSVAIRTKDEAYGSLMAEKRIGDTVVSISPGGSHSVQVTTEFDYGARVNGPVALRQPAASTSALPVTLPFVLGKPSVQSDVKLYTTGRGRTIAQRFTHNGADEPFFIGRIERQIAGAGEDTGAEVAA